MHSVAGIYIEPRRLANVQVNVEIFFDVLCNNDLFLFCGKGDAEYFQRVLKHPRLTLIELPTRNLNAQTYSDLLMTEEFWARFKNYTHALTIQSDGCLCKESAYHLEDFLHYDYVGGYAEQGWWVNQGFFDEKTALDLKSAHQCFNGGFSLRNVNATLEVIKKFPPRMSKSWANKPKFHIHYPEDLYFVLGMILLNKNVGVDLNATKFCSHGSFIENTFCIHNLAKFADEKELDRAFAYCSEYQQFVTAKVISAEVTS